MPAYSNVNAVTALSSGTPVKVWDAEIPAPVSASQQVSIPPSKVNSQRGISASGKFSDAPGAFEIDIQVAAVDSDAYYQTISNGNITTVDAINQTFIMEFLTSQPFARMLMRSRTNPVSIVAYFNLG